MAAFEAGRDGFGCSRASKRTALVSSLDSLLEETVTSELVSEGRQIPCWQRINRDFSPIWGQRRRNPSELVI